MERVTTRDRIEKMAEISLMGRPLHIVPDAMLDWLRDNGFYIAPASTKFHGDYEGGLFDHSWNVMGQLVETTKSMGLTWERAESPYIVGVFHDLCKIDQYIHNTSWSPEWEYNKKMILQGHGEKSVMLLSQFMTLTEEEICCIRYHMGIFTKDYEWNDFTRAVRKYPNVLWTHHADMYATHVLEERA